MKKITFTMNKCPLKNYFFNTCSISLCSSGIKTKSPVNTAIGSFYLTSSNLEKDYQIKVVCKVQSSIMFIFRIKTLSFISLHSHENVLQTWFPKRIKNMSITKIDIQKGTFNLEMPIIYMDKKEEFITKKHIFNIVCILKVQ